MPWRVDTFRKTRHYLFVGRYFSRTSALLISENSLILLASSAVRFKATARYDSVASLAIPAIIGF
jgi:hypothetical protein